MSTVATILRVRLQSKIMDGHAADGEHELATRQRSTIRLLESNLAYLIQPNYVFLKTRLEPYATAMNDLFLKGLLLAHEIIRASTIYDDRNKVEFILKGILEKSEDKHEEFVRRILDKGFLQTNDLKEFKQLPDSAIEEFRDFEISDFTNDAIKNFLKEELEVDCLVDYMFERHLITIDEHTNIIHTATRNAQVDVILTILQQRNDKSWIHNFCYILRQRNHKRVLTKIHSMKQTTYQQVLVDDMEFPQSGSTLKLTTDTDTEEAIMQEPLFNLRRLLQVDQSSFLVDVQTGCVQFILFSISDKACHKWTEDMQEKMCLKFVQSLIAIPSVKSTIKVGQLFKIHTRRYDESTPLPEPDGHEVTNGLSLNVALKISRAYLLDTMNVESTRTLLHKSGIMNDKISDTLSEITDNLLQKEYLLHFLTTCTENQLDDMLRKARDLDESRLVADYIGNWKCIECYRETIKSSFSTIKDEISTDIMKRTMKDIDVPAMIKTACISNASDVSRAERANIFLQYILMKRDLLQSFAEVFATQSKINLQFVPCSTRACLNTKISGINKKEDTLSATSEFTYIIETNGKNELIVSLLDKGNFHLHQSRHNGIGSELDSPRIEGTSDISRTARMFLPL